MYAPHPSDAQHRRRKSVFIYYGAKSSISARQQIHRAFPKTLSEYREPFVGGGSIAMTIPTSIPRWINDADDALISVYRVLATRPGKFIADVRALVSDNTDENTNTFNRLLVDESMDVAVRFMFLNRFAYNGRVWLEPEWRYRTHFSEHDGDRFFRTNRLECAARIINGMHITCGDFAPVLRAEGENIFSFVDAPYMLDTLGSYGPSRRYFHGFSLADHERLRDTVASLDPSRHKILMTYDDHPHIRFLYRSSAFKLVPASWRYMSSSQRGEKKCGNELLITNYEW